jgi:PAS domain-containing protein
LTIRPPGCRRAARCAFWPRPQTRWFPADAFPFYRIGHKTTVLKQVDSRLADSEALFQAAFEQAPVGVAVLENFRSLSKINTAMRK